MSQAAWRIPNKKPPEDWPHEGNVKFDNYGTRYRPGLDLVLKNIDCSVNPREKVRNKYEELKFSPPFRTFIVNLHNLDWLDITDVK